VSPRWRAIIQYEDDEGVTVTKYVEASGGAHVPLLDACRAGLVPWDRAFRVEVVSSDVLQAPA
jgi:hypothetical protein